MSSEGPSGQATFIEPCLHGTGVVQILIHIPIVHDSEIPLKPSKRSTMVPKQTTVADIRAA
jgi:hypothetical protein